MGIRTFFGQLFGSPNAMSEIVSGAVDGIDKLIYTDEEKSEAAAKDRSEARQMVVAWMAATQGQNLARRMIALSITGVWLIQHVIAIGAQGLAVFIKKDEDLMALASFLRESASDMDAAVMLILAFYFAAPHMGDIAKAVTGRFKQSVNKG